MSSIVEKKVLHQVRHEREIFNSLYFLRRRKLEHGKHFKEKISKLPSTETTPEASVLFEVH